MAVGNRGCRTRAASVRSGAGCFRNNEQPVRSAVRSDSGRPRTAAYSDCYHSRAATDGDRRVGSRRHRHCRRNAAGAGRRNAVGTGHRCSWARSHRRGARPCSDGTSPWANDATGRVF